MVIVGLIPPALLLLSIPLLIVFIVVLLPDMLGGHHAHEPHAHEHAVIWLCSPVAFGHLVVVLFAILLVILVHRLVVHT